MSLADQDGTIWLNGEYIPWRDAKVHVLTHTLHYGVGVFEGVRAYATEKGPAIFRLHDHTNRLFQSAHILGMNVPYEKDLINAVQTEIIKLNGFKSAYLRPLCFYGPEALGLHADKLKVHVMIATWNWGAYLGGESLEKGIRVLVSSLRRNHSASTFNKAKANGHYINSIMALQEALRLNYDEALMLDHEGFVAEGSGENFFIVRKGVIYTPDPSNILEGITRETIMQLARERGYSVVEKRITRDEVYIADEAFFTGTAAEVIPIREVDNRPIGSGSRGPITSELQQAYFDIVNGRNEKYDEWLTYI